MTKQIYSKILSAAAVLSSMMLANGCSVPGDRPEVCEPGSMEARCKVVKKTTPQPTKTMESKEY